MIAPDSCQHAGPLPAEQMVEPDVHGVSAVRVVDTEVLLKIVGQLQQPEEMNITESAVRKLARDAQLPDERLLQKSLEEGESPIGTRPSARRTPCPVLHLCRASMRALPATRDR